MRFPTYEELKGHRQIHDKKNVEIAAVGGDSAAAGGAGVGGSSNSITVHSRLGAMADIGNRGGVKCLLCNTFKLRKDHLRNHYVKHHGYDPKQLPNEKKAKAVKKEEEVENIPQNNESVANEDQLLDGKDDSLACPSCHEGFSSRHLLIRHALKAHTAYTGTICPYCWGRHPERYIDLKVSFQVVNPLSIQFNIKGCFYTSFFHQAHVTQNHIDQLMGYNVNNSCKVCKSEFQGYAELRDHVQVRPQFTC